MEQQQHMDGSVYIIMMIILNYVFEGGQSAMWTGSGTCDKIILFENITITSQTNAIAWPFSITSSVSASSASWNSEAFTGTKCCWCFVFKF